MYSVPQNLIIISTSLFLFTERFMSYRLGATAQHGHYVSGTCTDTYLHVWKSTFSDLHYCSPRQSSLFLTAFSWRKDNLRECFFATGSNGQLAHKCAYLPLCKLLLICDVVTSLWQLQHMLTWGSHFRKVLNLFLASFSEI